MNPNSTKNRKIDMKKTSMKNKLFDQEVDLNK